MASGSAETGTGLPSRGRLALRALLGLLTGFAVLAALSWYKGIDPAEVARDVAGVPPWGLAGCFASAYVVFACQSLRWHAVMGPLLGLRYTQAYRAQAVGAMFNIIGFRAGDLLRVQY